MASRTDFDDLDIVVRRRKGRYFSTIPQIGLYAVANSVNESLDTLNAKKERLVADLNAAEALDDFEISRTWPPAHAGTPGFLFGIFGFFLKTAIVAAAGAFVLMFTVNTTERAVEQFTQNVIPAVLDRIAHPGGRPFWTKARQQLDLAAAPKNDLSDAERQQLLTDIHVLVERWHPFVQEAMALFSDSAVPPVAR